MADLVVADLMAYERHAYMDPMLVLERKQAREARKPQTKSERAREELEKLFKEKRDDVQG